MRAQEYEHNEHDLSHRRQGQQKLQQSRRDSLKIHKAHECFGSGCHFK